jgi:hypothetical protein
LLTKVERGEIDPSFVITHGADIERGPPDAADPRV